MGGARPSEVSEEVFGNFRNHLLSLDKQHFTSKELYDIFKSLKNSYPYSPSYFAFLLRQKLGMYYYKPSPQDYRQSEQAEAQLQDRFQATLAALKVMGKDVNQMLIGFSDECAQQFHNNNARFWSLFPHLPRKINSELGSQKFFGFYALTGKSLLKKMLGCKGEDLKPFLLAIKAANPDKKGIILFWDNATSHKKVEQWAWEQGIYMICLPPYSPDLNPIERLWKTCKRWVNEQGYCKKLAEIASHFEQAFELYHVQLSFAAGWMDKMSSIFSWNNPVNVSPN